MKEVLIITDFDGCFADSKTRRDGFFEEICKKYGKPDPKKIIVEMSDGMPRKMADEYAALGFEWERDKKMIWGDFIEYFNANPPEIFRGTRDAIEKCRRDGFKTAIGSLNSNKLILPFIGMHNLESLFHTVKTKEDSKLKHRILLKCAEQLDVKPRDCIYLGDHLWDIDAAEKAGMTPISVGYGKFCSPEVLLGRIPQEQFAATPQDVYSTIIRNIKNNGSA